MHVASSDARCSGYYRQQRREGDGESSFLFFDEAVQDRLWVVATLLIVRATVLLAVIAVC